MSAKEQGRGLNACKVTEALFSYRQMSLDPKWM